MSNIMSLPEYEAEIARTRDKRMKWWREARYGMFVHYGLYSQLARHEWTMALESIPVEEYEKLADTFSPEPGSPAKWAALAKRAGMKYMVMTTKHHEGFCLWDSKLTDYNAAFKGPKRDIVAEYVDACRKEGLKIGFYYSLMDWHHPDSWRCAFDPEARKRFLDYTQGLVRELMSNYGKIDILWYDVSRPMQHHEGWNSLSINQMVRELQPDIIINNRSKLPEDFGTPEEHITAMDRDWEACMTFNGLSWGYVDSEQAAPYSYNAQGILRMLQRVTSGGGNLLLNIGPAPGGDVPREAVQPLETVGRWLEVHGDVIYGEVSPIAGKPTGVGMLTAKGNTAYLWAWIWPEGDFSLGGFQTKLRKVTHKATGKEIGFSQEPHRIKLQGLGPQMRDKIAGVTVLELEFETSPEAVRCSAYPQLHEGKEINP
ncbi:MAG: alpha-L-fucosidase [Spirochaetia bacterium]